MRNSRQTLTRRLAEGSAKCARALNAWLTSSDYFARFEATGEIIPRGCTGRTSDLREMLCSNEGRTYTVKFCTAVIRVLLTENSYAPVRAPGESWHAYCVRQGIKLQTYARKAKLNQRQTRHRQTWHAWLKPADTDADAEWDLEMDNEETQPMDHHVPALVRLRCVP